jgi:exopolyphosphatase/guanosine-5'-triphosphate,3'-diphosphate pyrophosphatase
MKHGSLLAAVDLGSNSFRLEVGRLEGRQVTRVDYLKEAVRLGAGLTDERRLSPEAMARGLACLKRFAERIRDFRPQAVRAVATQTLREAVNRDEFIAKGTAVLGFPIEVIAGREEARLIYQGVSHLLPGGGDAPERRLVIDIGGRSTEVILGQGHDSQITESYAVGSVGMTLRFFAEGRIAPHAFAQAIVAAKAELEEAQDLFGHALWDAAYGSSGTFGAVGDLLRANGVTDGRITPEGLHWCRQLLQQAGHIERLKAPGLKDDRKPVLAGGLAVIHALFETFDLPEIWPARGALRQGVLFEIVGREMQGIDPRHETVARLQQRFVADHAQAQRVERSALQFLAMLEPRASSQAQSETAWAARLHELGMSVSHSEFHKHGAYVIEHADAPGFSQPQQSRLAALVLGHRGRLRKIEAQLADRGFATQLLALRLAAIVCHARRDPEPRALALKPTALGFAISADGAWAERHPQSMYLLGEEVEAWRRSGFELKLGTMPPAPANQPARAAAGV